MKSRKQDSIIATWFFILIIIILATSLFKLLWLTLLSIIIAIGISFYVRLILLKYQTELYDEKEQLKITFDSIGDGVITTDLNKCVVKLNKVAEEFTGWKESEAFSKSFNEVFDIKNEKTGENAKDPVEEVLLTDRTCLLENHTILTSKDGKKRHIADSAAPIKDQNGETNGVVMIFRDVTERKLAAEALKLSEEKLRHLLDSTAEAIYGINMEGECTFCNTSCLRMLGYKHEDELLGQKMHFKIHYKNIDGEHVPQEECSVHRAFKIGQGTHVDNEVFWKANGTCFPVEYFSYPQFHNGVIIGAVITFFDITERKKAMKALYESERSKTVLLANLPGMAYRCKFDHDYTMQFISDGCHELTGYRTKDLLQNNKTTYNALILPEYRNSIWNLWIESINEKKICRLEYPITTSNGDVKWVFEQGQGIYDDNGECIAIEGLIIDISYQKKKEEEIIYLNQHDYLTELYNRTFFEQEKVHLDTESLLPVSVIIGDINGLKLINDALGHVQGDKLIIETAKILKSCCRADDILARVGGDEFSILLPHTSSDVAYDILKKIRAACDEYNNKTCNETYYINISLGYATKNSVEEDINEIIKIAEDYMYRSKLLEHKSLHSFIITSMKTTMFERSQETEAHAERLIELSKSLGMKFNLTDDQLNALELFATLHDIGKISIDNHILNKPDKLNDDEWVEMKKHPEAGYRIAMASNELIPIAEYILCHHEHWDGGGYPQGLVGEEIPLLARILAVVDAYDAMTQNRSYRKAISKEAALIEIRRNAGTQFDPKVVRAFMEICYIGNDPEYMSYMC